MAGRTIPQAWLKVPSLWGIDSDSDAPYLDEVFADECENLAAMLEALGVTVTP